VQSIGGDFGTMIFAVRDTSPEGRTRANRRFSDPDMLLSPCQQTGRE
jgi:hypothetical protein